MNEPTITQIKDTTANPAPLGLLGFGMTTVLLNMHNAGFFGLNSMILAMGICYGGTAQVIAGIMEWKKGNTFATTAFISYGFFWLSLVALLVLPKLNLRWPPAGKRHACLSRLVGTFHRRDVHRHIPAEPRVAGGLWHADDFVLPAGLRRFYRSPATPSNITPATRDWFAAFRRFTPASRKFSTSFTGKSFCRSVWSRNKFTLITKMLLAGATLALLLKSQPKTRTVAPVK